MVIAGRARISRVIVRTPSSRSALIFWASTSTGKIIDELIANLPEAKMIIVFTEESAEKSKALVYSQKGLEPLTLFKDYQASGSNKFCQLEINSQIEENKEKILTLAQKALAKLSS